MIARHTFRAGALGERRDVLLDTSEQSEELLSLAGCET